MLGRPLLHLSCRHHVCEVMLSGAFHATFGPSSGPEVSIFQEFRKGWSQIDVARYEPGIADRFVRKAVEQKEEAVIRFAVLQLEEQQPRDDYREFLELVLLFLGTTPPRGTRIMAPGAISNARFMAKTIYCLKMFLFRSQVNLSVPLKKQLRNFCCFIINHYVISWFTAPLPTKAPRQDLLLLQGLLSFPRSDDATVSLAALDKLSRHLWYLGERLVALAFFDSDVSDEVKRQMVVALNQQPGDERHKTRKIVPRARNDATSVKGPLVKKLKELPKTLDGFVTQNTMEFFTILELPIDFLQVDPSEWPTNESYKTALNVVQHIRVVNDTAERGVALAQRYKGKVTKDHVQKQYLYQTVHKDRQDHKKASKKDYA